MYGEGLGTGTLCDMLAMRARAVRDRRDDGFPADADMLDECRSLMEGATVLWTRVAEELAEGGDA